VAACALVGEFLCLFCLLAVLWLIPTIAEAQTTPVIGLGVGITHGRAADRKRHSHSGPIQEIAREPNLQWYGTFAIRFRAEWRVR
jgi:hypothetical protein